MTTEPRAHAVSDIVWAAMLDGRYKAVVVRKGQYRGSLELWDGPELMLERGVGLAYGAVFGPDIENVNEWQRICMEFVEKWTRTFHCAACKKPVPREDLRHFDHIPEKVLCQRCADPWNSYLVPIAIVSVIIAILVWAGLKVFGVF